MNRFAHRHAKVEKTDAVIKPGINALHSFMAASSQEQATRCTRKRWVQAAEPVPPGEGGVLRCSKRLVISNGNHALRGAVNWGAEKNRIVT